MKETTILKTPCQDERETRDLAIYREYNELMKIDGQSKTAVKDFLMKKYGIHSQSTIYVIIKRVEEQQQSKGAAYGE